MKFLLFYLFSALLTLNIQAQLVNSYEIKTDFFPDDAQMWGYSVSNETFLRGSSLVHLKEVNTDTICFYLHGELKIDSILSGNKKVDYDSEKVFFRKNYSRVALKTSLISDNIAGDKKLSIHYSGFMNPSRARSLSDYMRINKETGVFLRSYGYSLWFPVFIEPKQDPYKTDFNKVEITLPKQFKCVVAGKQIKEKTENGKRISIWKPGKANISHLQITAQEYKTIASEQVFVYYRSNKKNAENIIDYATQLKQLFNKKLKKVHENAPLYILEMPKYGNISSSNIVGISSGLFDKFDSNLGAKLTIAHELVHPYVTIPVSNDNPFAALVAEGFPSFFQVYALHKTVHDSIYNIEKHMKKVEERYLQRKKTGKNRRGYDLPPEKPILQISYDEIGNYKDTFILSDRVWLFLYDLWTRMGDQKFETFLIDLFSYETIDYEKFERLILTYLPDYKEKLYTWLKTNEYPGLN
jgi:hypothetical protein